MPIRRLDDGYKVKTGEVETRDDLLIAYSRSRFHRDPVVGFKQEQSCRQAIWVIKEPDNWGHIVKEWRSVREIFEPFSLEVRALRNAVKENYQQPVVASERCWNCHKELTRCDCKGKREKRTFS